MTAKITRVRTEDVTFSKRGRRGSKYDAMFEEMAALEPGQTVLVQIGPLSSPIAHNRISSAIFRNGPPPPDGCKWRRRTTDHDAIAISAVPLES